MRYPKKNRNSNRLKVVIIFFQSPSDVALSKIKKYLSSHLRSVSGFFGKELSNAPFSHLGLIDNFPAYLTSHPADEIMIVGTPQPGEVSQEFLLSLKFSKARIKMIPLHFDLLSSLVKMNDVNDIPHIRLYPNEMTYFDRAAKFLLNKTGGILGLLFTAILFPFIAIVIKSTSKGPIIYKQKRLGKHGKPFMLYKFRTMYITAEEAGPQLSHDLDRRITKGGNFLRYWHIDEMLQFWNILKGDMALVGPRPERPFYAKYLSKQIPYYKIIYQEKPGLTSLGMIKYGYASSVEEMSDRLYYDIVYLNNPSFLKDLKILGNTLWYIVQKSFYDPSEKRNQYSQSENLTDPQDPIVRWLSLKNRKTI